MTQIQLLFPENKVVKETSYAEGFLFDEQNNYYKNEELLTYFAQAKSWEAFKALCRKANGLFRIIMPYDGELWTATDHRASYHIYSYRNEAGTLFLAPNGFDLVEQIGDQKEWDTPALAFFLNKGCTPRHKTLLKGLHSLPPATAMRYRAEDGFTSFERYELLPSYNNAFDDLTETEAMKLFQAHLDRATERLIRHLNGRKVVICVTGGFDSRLIATQLKRFDYKNVLCVSYGKEGNDDMRKGKLVAKALGFEHQYIPSVDLNKLSDYRNDPEFLDYMHYMTGLSASYFYQEFIPSRVIANAPLAQENPVFMAGHQGDEIGGSQARERDFLTDKKLSDDELVNRLIGHKFYNQDFSKTAKTIIKKEIKASLMELKAMSNPDTLSMNLFEGFVCNEDYPKYILNCQHSWRYRGFETTTLFTDKELYNFAYSLPARFRFGKYLYDEMAMKLFEQYGINFDDDLHLRAEINKPFFRFKQAIKPIVKPLLPKQNIFRIDFIGFESIMQPLLKAVEEDGRFSPTTINGLSFAWYLMHLEQKFGLPLPKEIV